MHKSKGLHRRSVRVASTVALTANMEMMEPEARRSRRSAWCKMLLGLIAVGEASAFAPLSSLHLKPVLASARNFFGCSMLRHAPSTSMPDAFSFSPLEIECKARPRKGFQPRRKGGRNQGERDVFNLQVAVAPMAPELTADADACQSGLTLGDIERRYLGGEKELTAYSHLRHLEVLQTDLDLSRQMEATKDEDEDQPHVHPCRAWKFLSGHGRGGKEYTVVVNEEHDIILELAHGSSAVMLQSAGGKIQRCWGDGDLYERFNFMGSQELHEEAMNGEGTKLPEFLDFASYGGWKMTVERDSESSDIVLRGAFKEEQAMIFLSDTGMTITGTGARCVVVQSGEAPVVVPVSRLPEQYQRFIAGGRQRLQKKTAKKATVSATKAATAHATMATGEAQRSEQDGDLPTEFLCPIAGAIMWDASVAADGHSYSERAFQAHLAAGNLNSPVTGEPLAHTLLVPNLLIRNLLASECASLSPGGNPDAAEKQLPVQVDAAEPQDDGSQQLSVPPRPSGQRLRSSSCVCVEPDCEERSRRQVKALEAEVALLRARVASSDRRRVRDRSGGRLSRIGGLSPAMPNETPPPPPTEPPPPLASVDKALAEERKEGSVGRRMGAEEWRKRMRGSHQHAAADTMGAAGLRRGRWVATEGGATVTLDRAAAGAGAGAVGEGLPAVAGSVLPAGRGFGKAAKQPGTTTAKREGRQGRRKKTGARAAARKQRGRVQH